MMGSWGRFHQHFMSSFCARRSKSAKKTDNLTAVLELSGSVCVKAVCRTLMQLTPGVSPTKLCLSNFCITIKNEFAKK